MAIYAVLSPWILSRAIDASTYSAYILGVQAVPFLLILATPIQSALAPRVAHHITLRQQGELISLIRIAVRYFLFAALAASIAALVLAWALPWLLIWRDPFARNASHSILVLGVATALTFPAFVVTSYAAGHQNFLWDNLLKCLGPYLGLIFIASVWLFHGKSLHSMSVDQVVALLGAANILSGGFVVAFGFKKLPVKFWKGGANSSIQPPALSTKVRGTYWWQVCALLSVGTGSFFVSRVAPNSVAPFAIAGSMMTVIAGVSSALSGPFAVKMAGHAGREAQERTALFRHFQSYFMAFLFVSTVFLLALPDYVLVVWLGEHLGHEVGALLFPLALGNYLRQITSPYTTAVLGLGKQRDLWLSPAIEVLVAITLSYLLGQFFGVRGVAYALLVSALVRLLMTVVHDLPLTRDALPLTAYHLLFPWLVGSVRK